MGFNLFHALGGFAARESEKIDKAREESVDIAKTTLKYYADRGMEARRQKNQAFRDSLKIAENLRDNFNFTPRQLGVLASQGKLKDVQDYYTNWQMDNKRTGKNTALPDPNTIVSVMEDKPINMPMSDYLRKILVGDPNLSTTEVDSMANVPIDSALGKLGFTGGNAAKKYREQFEASLGVPAAELAAYASDDFTTDREQGAINLESLRTTGTTSDERVEFNQAYKHLGRQLASGLGLEAGTIPGTDAFTGILGRAESAIYFNNQIQSAANEVARLVRDEKMPYDVALTQVQNNMFSDDNIANYREMQRKFAGVGGTGEPGVGGSSVTSYLFDQNEANQIKGIDNINDLRKYVAAWVSQSPNRRNIGRQLMQLFKTEKNIDTLKNNILQFQLGSGSGPRPSDPEQNPIQRYRKPDSTTPTPSTDSPAKSKGQMGRRNKNALLQTEEGKEVVAQTRKRLEKQGVDTTDKDAVIRSLVAQISPQMGKARPAFKDVSDEEFNRNMRMQFDQMADEIVKDSMAGMA